MTGKKVLIIDDDPNTITTLGKLFTDRGAQVSTASSYGAGLESLKKETPDVAVVDLLLPEHSGLELVKTARALPGEHPFFVILTNSINAEHVADAMEANVTMFIQKADHDPAEIVDMVMKRMSGN